MSHHVEDCGAGMQSGVLSSQLKGGPRCTGTNFGPYGRDRATQSMKSAVMTSTSRSSKERGHCARTMSVTMPTEWVRCFYDGLEQSVHSGGVVPGTNIPTPLFCPVYHTGLAPNNDLGSMVSTTGDPQDVYRTNMVFCNVETVP